ncbi:MAG TPA: helix-turn-helix transcriptional regulator [Candidatus Polarisedimenticolia bacterium]|nr:helix-turn-helix transcriptional regulator [Candidatus Polarisedimenticolia bacterium]
MSSGKKQPAKIGLKVIGRRIRELRGFDLTQAQFGKMLGIPQTTLSKYEKGQAAPPLDFLVRLKAHSGKSIDWIVTGEEKHDGGN